MDVPQFIAGRFRIEGEIGTGGMGTVYRATHLGLQRSVAVKIIKSEFAGDRDVADRFMREARTMAKLRHPRAAMIFDAGNLPDGRHFIIMEFVEGTTLSEALVRDGRFSAERAVSIAVQICDVLEEAHLLGIIHRDLKPSNIMLNERGVCVLDFGVAKVLASSADATASHASTGSGQIIGTPRYMSPEQCLGQRVGARSDLYSLGILLYEMLTGRPPFIDPLPSALLVKQATAPPPPLPKLRQDIPRALALAVHTLLAKQPEDRPKTAAHARAMLEKSLAAPVRITPEAEPLSSTVAAALSKKRSVVFRVAAPLLLVTILGALLLVLGYRGETAEVTAPRDAFASGSKLPVGATPATSRSRADEKVDATLKASDTKSAETKLASPTSLSLEEAKRIAGSISHGSIGDVAIVQTAAGPAIVAIHDERKMGTTHFFMMERRGAGYHVSARGSLDNPEFRGATWKTETLDADGDGQTEVLFTGAEANGHASDYRLVLYVPRTRQTYSLRIEVDGHNARKRRVIWSANAATPEAEPYRKVLARRVRSI
jgi:predicted Ser/Thr protein kinase